MGRRGPAPLPSNLRVLHGVRPYRRNIYEPLPPDELPSAPAWLSEPAKAIFEDTVRRLDSMGVAFEVDTLALVGYANAIANFQRAQMIIDASNVVIKGADGKSIIKNSASGQAALWLGIAARYEREFGLTPSARVGLGQRAGDSSSIPLGSEVVDRLLS